MQFTTCPPGDAAAWFYSLTDRSWAAVRWTNGDGRDGEVYQQGPRRLWDRVEAVQGWWEKQGRPGLERFGLTATAGGVTPWLDGPANRLPGRHDSRRRE
ncbi:hypothetical protein [Streptomyces roseoviridis]|uniref:Uncharacterized protein n=1 Tax=Streptomyces roseoviridis TaxID=67361 RepID=A0ABV5QIQ9_9ACTN